MSTEGQFDLIVIGGGPGGSTLASVVRKHNHKVLVLERETFPRYQIGESLLPSSLGICRLIGAFDEVAKAGFNPKNGGLWYWGDKPAWKFNFGEGSANNPLVGEHWAYQVERSRFDEVLLNNSRRLGADVQERCEVKEVIREGGRAVGVRYSDAQGNIKSARARVIADASGNTSPFHSLVGKRMMAPRFRNLRNRSCDSRIYREGKASACVAQFRRGACRAGRESVGPCDPKERGASTLNP